MHRCHQTQSATAPPVSRCVVHIVYLRWDGAHMVEHSVTDGEFKVLLRSPVYRRFTSPLSIRMTYCKPLAVTTRSTADDDRSQPIDLNWQNDDRSGGGPIPLICINRLAVLLCAASSVEYRKNGLQNIASEFYSRVLLLQSSENLFEERWTEPKAEPKAEQKTGQNAERGRARKSLKTSVSSPSIAIRRIVYNLRFRSEGAQFLQFTAFSTRHWKLFTESSLFRALLMKNPFQASI